MIHQSPVTTDFLPHCRELKTEVLSQLYLQIIKANCCKFATNWFRQISAVSKMHTLELLSISASLKHTKILQYVASSSPLPWQKCDFPVRFPFFSLCWHANANACLRASALCNHTCTIPFFFQDRALWNTELLRNQRFKKSGYQRRSPVRCFHCQLTLPHEAKKGQLLISLEGTDQIGILQGLCRWIIMFKRTPLKDKLVLAYYLMRIDAFYKLPLNAWINESWNIGRPFQIPFQNPDLVFKITCH